MTQTQPKRTYQMPILPATTELTIIAMMERISDSQRRQFTADPKKFLDKNLHIEIPPATLIDFTHNTDNQVALMLPYYNSPHAATALLPAKGGCRLADTAAIIGIAIGLSVGDICSHL